MMLSEIVDKTTDGRRRLTSRYPNSSHWADFCLGELKSWDKNMFVLIFYKIITVHWFHYTYALLWGILESLYILVFSTISIFCVKLEVFPKSHRSLSLYNFNYGYGTAKYNKNLFIRTKKSRNVKKMHIKFKLKQGEKNIQPF